MPLDSTTTAWCGCDQQQTAWCFETDGCDQQQLSGALRQMAVINY